MVFVPSTSSDLPANKPAIKVNVVTIVEPEPTLLDETTKVNRIAVISIDIKNIALPLVIGALSRAAFYAQALAINDINPLSGVNGSLIDPGFNNGLVNNPSGDIEINVDKTQDTPVCNLALRSTRVRLDYLDEFFGRTLSYVEGAIADDLNPEV